MRRRLGMVVVRGRSMEPTLFDGDRALVLWGGAPRVGRLAVVRLPDSPTGPRPTAVKRVTGRVDGGWWVERDNRAEGVDSWLVGAVPEADVLGRVLVRVRRVRRVRRIRQGGALGPGRRWPGLARGQGRE